MSVLRTNLLVNRYSKAGRVTQVVEHLPSKHEFKPQCHQKQKTVFKGHLVF
jgi:hypothetical protein